MKNKANMFKRLLSVVTAILILLPVIASAFTVGAEEVKEILEQPTSESPTVKVSDTQGASYQWYEYELGESVEVTDQNANGMEGAEYGEDGWSNGYTVPQVFFEIEMLEGEVLIIDEPPTTNIYDIYVFSDGNSYAGEFTEDGNLRFEIPKDGTYGILFHGDGDQSYKIKAHVLKYEEKKLEGQNTSTLTEYKVGNAYLVTVTYEDGTELVSDRFFVDYAITSMPTRENPSVGTNKDEDVEGYKWYYVSTEGEPYTVVNNDNELRAYVYYGIYEDGKWNGGDEGNRYINLAFTINSGDVLKIKTPEGFDGYVGPYDGNEEYATDENGIYYLEATEETYVDFEISSDTEISGVEIYVERGEKTISVLATSYFDKSRMELYPVYVESGMFDGESWKTEYQTLALIFEFQIEDTGYFEITAPDGFEFGAFDIYADEYIEATDENKFYVSSGLYGIFAFSDSEDGAVDIKFNDGENNYDVKKWKSVLDDEERTLQVDDINDGYYENEKWYPDGNNNEIDLEFTLDKGYILTVVTSEEFDGSVTLDVTDADGLEIELEKVDGKYIFVADKNYDFDLELENCEENFSAVITVQKGKTVLLENENEKSVRFVGKGYYFVEVEFKNGTKVRSDAFEVETEVSFDTNGGTSIGNSTVSRLTEIPKTERKGFVLEGWYTDAELENRVELPFDVAGVVTLYAKWEICDHKESANQPSCTDDTVCTICDGVYSAYGHTLQAGYTVTKDSHYYECTSCRVKIDETAHTFTQWQTTKYETRTENGEKARACTSCGTIEYCEIEAWGGLSNGATVGVIIGSGVVLFAVAIAVAWFVLKKKSFKA